MALVSAVDVEITFDNIPVFPGVIEALAQGILPGAIERNKDSCADRVIMGPAVTQEMVDLCFDAQTSGGLLISVAPDKAKDLLNELHKKGVPDAAIIGKVKSKGTGRVFIETNGKRTIPSAKIETRTIRQAYIQDD